MKRSLISLAAGAVLLIAGTASALSIADLQGQIESLLRQIGQLQAQQQSQVQVGTAIPASTGSVAPDSCKVWYDGCNTCTRAYAGGPLSCTEVQCIWNAGSSCKEYFDPSPSTGVPAFCQYATPNLARGTSGSIVLALQQFLASQGLLYATPTGYFGPATEAAVQQWQAQNALVSYGTPYTTGWGTVGPRTWAALRRLCSPIVGGDVDAHGCIPSAGYTWCSSLNQCIRPWETQCPTRTSSDDPSADPRCKVWYDGCNTCSRTTPGGAGICTLLACFAHNQPYCKEQFSGSGTVCPAIYQPVCGRPSGCAPTNCPAGSMCPMLCRQPDPQSYSNRCSLDAAGAYYLYDGACTASSNQPPAISGISGPTTLSVGQTGTWSVSASDPENGQLTYSIRWGDEAVYPMYANMAVSSPAYQQTSTFTHSYASQGTYTVTATVTDAQGLSAQTSITVSVTASGGIACTQEYVPVCGQPPEPACRHSVPACLIATPGPQTYSNTCMLNAAGATLLYYGACNSNSGLYTCPNDPYCQCDAAGNAVLCQ